MGEELIDTSKVGLVSADRINDEVADKYNGTKVKVLKVEPGKKRSTYKDNKPLPQGEFIETPCINVTTENFGTDAFGDPLFVTEQLGLQNRGGKWGFSDSKKSRGRNFMKNLKLNSINEAVGREVLVVKKVRQNGKATLVINIPE
jgi:hypothetical protein